MQIADNVPWVSLMVVVVNMDQVVYNDRNDAWTNHAVVSLNIFEWNTQKIPHEGPIYNSNEALQVVLTVQNIIRTASFVVYYHLN